MKRLFVFVYMMLFVVIGMSAQSNTTFGDVNSDGHINKSDINNIVDIIMEKTPSVPKESADVNKDGKVNAADIVYVVNETLKNQSLVISFKNGTKACYKLDNLVNTTFTTDALVVTTDKKSISYPLSEVSQYTYESVEDESDNTNYGDPTPMTDSYEYFTINFTDGTKSQAFYTTDVDYISYSKTDMEGVEHSNYQVQEIHTIGEVIRYPLTLIENVAFLDVNINTIAERITNVSESIVPYYTKCNSTSELFQYMSSIKQTDGAEDAWTDNQTLFVKVRDWGTISFYYPIGRNRNKTLVRNANRATHNYTNIDIHNHVSFEAKSICIVNQLVNDYSFILDTKDKEILELECRKLGLKAVSNNAPLPSFFQEDIFNYDLVFIDTHGSYDAQDKIHWLFTGEKLGESKEVSSYDSKELKIKNIDKIVKEWVVRIFYDYKHPSPKNLSIGWVKDYLENRNWKVSFYTKISEKFIESSTNEFKNKGKAIIFNAACQSVKGDDGKDNNSLADIFISKGAGCYLGYNNTDTVGGEAGFNFIKELLNGKCTESAFRSLPERMKKEEKTVYAFSVYETQNSPNPYYEFENDKPEILGVKYHGDDDYIIDDINNEKRYFKLKRVDDTLLRMVPNKSSICISSPLTLACSTDDDTKYKMEGCIKLLNNPEFDESYKFGFQLSTNSDMSQAESKETDTKSYDDATLYMNWELTLTDKDLKPNTTYYYRAYMNDGYSDCYGEIKSFTTTGDDGGEPEAYTVLDGETLTFYYDNKKNERTGEISTPSVLTTIGEKNYKGRMYNGQVDLFDNKVVKVVSFDPSFQKYTPQTTDYWFSLYTKLTTIKNLKYLNTTNVTSMFNMFYGCKSLTDIDLSNFNTSNVTDMGQLFEGCRSLKNLNLSSFNTTNVTNMSSMFSGCSSLNSLDLSSFNTTEVTNMYYMFYGCSSLTNLDISSFNTIKVTDMSNMFFGCSSLTSLNLSSFNTTNVTNMSSMFYKCSLLTNLDLSGFNTKNVTDMSSMFNDCSSLTSLDMSGFNFANITKAKRRDIFNGCSLLTSLNMSGCIFPDDISSLFSGKSLLASLNLSKANTANVTNMRSLFSGCSSLKNIDLSSFNTTNVTNMCSMFYGCSSLTSLDLSSFNTANVTDMSDMFYGCSSLTSLDLSSFNTTNVTNMSSIFSGCSSLKILDMSGLTFPQNISSLFYGLSSLTNLNLKRANITNVTGTSYLFYGCSSLTDLDMSGVIFPKYVSSFFSRSLINLNLSGANFANATDMSSTFSGCSSLTNIDMSEVIFPEDCLMLFSGLSSLTNLNLSGVNTTNVTNMGSMFSGCSSLTGLNLSSFNTANVTNMGAMFGGCSSLNNLNLSSFNTANVTNMGAMFRDCSSLNSLDLSGFNTTNVTDMGGMFYGCSSLKTIFANWKVHGYGSKMFFGCDELVGGKGTKIGDNLYGYDQYGNPLYYQCGTDSFAAHVDGGKDNPGLFTAK